MLKQAVLIFTLTMLLHHSVHAQTVSARVKFNKQASTVAGIIPDGAEGDYVSASTVAATADRPARNMVKVTIRRIPPGAQTNLRVGDEVWVFHGPDVMSFRDNRGQEITDVENTLFKGRATAPIGGRANKPLLPPTPPPQAIAAPVSAQVVRQEPSRADTGRVAATTVDPNLARSTDKKKTEADFCLSGRCLANKKQENTDDIEQVKEEIHRNYTKSAQNVWASDPVVSSYSNSPKVANLIAVAKARAKGPSKGKCYNYTKTALEKASMVSYRPTSVNAKDAITDLKEQGWINLMDNPKYKRILTSPNEAPKGAMIVYRNTRNSKHAGHNEFKTHWGDEGGKEGGYVSDFFRSNSTTLLNREMIGVMIKENP